MQQLAESIHRRSKQAEHTTRCNDVLKQRRRRQIWKKKEKAKADEIIATLPSILRKAARERHEDGPYFPKFGHRKYRVLTLNPDQGSDGVVENLRGAAAHIRDWALTNGFRVELYLDIDTGADWSGYHLYIEW